MFVRVLFAQDLRGNILRELSRKASQIAIVDWRSLSTNLRHIVRDIHGLAEQSATERRRDIILKQIMTISALQQAQSGTGLIAHDPHCVTLINILDGILQGHDLVGSDGVSRLSGGRVGDAGKASDLARRANEQLMFDPASDILTHLIDHEAHDIKLGIVDKAIGDLGQCASEIAGKLNALELAIGRSQWRELLSVSHINTAIGSIVVRELKLTLDVVLL